jgi:hypothetical protein
MIFQGAQSERVHHSGRIQHLLTKSSLRLHAFGCTLLAELETGSVYPSFHGPYLAQNSSELLVNRYMEC